MTYRILFLLLAGLLSACVTTGKVNPLTTDKGRAEAVKAYVQLGIGYIRQGSTERAKAPLKQALEIDPGSADANATLGYVFQLEKEPKTADEYYRKALSGGHDARILNNYGSFLFEQQRYSEAFDQFSKAAEDQLYSERSLVFENLGRTALKMNRRSEARDYFERSLRMNRQQPRVLFEMASMSYEDRQYVEARDYYGSFLQFRTRPEPRTLLLGFNLSRVFRDEAAAASYREQLQQLFPGAPESRQAVSEQ